MASKKFREIQFKRILQHIWVWIKGLNRKSSIETGDENVSGGTPPSPKKKPITNVERNLLNYQMAMTISANGVVENVNFPLLCLAL